MDFTKTNFTCLSFCTGIRGLERGLERAISNLRTICNVEVESFIIENLVAQMESGLLAPAPIWSDLKTFDPTPFRGMVDIITGGYPCQPFSTAGKRRGTEDPRHLFPYIERAVGIIRPRICFFENVRGHVTCGLPEVIASMEGLGYRVHWGIYSAEETGAAHKRERVFILAVVNSELQSLNSSIGWVWRESDSTSEELGNPNNTGLQGRLSGECEECTGEWITRSNGPFDRVEKKIVSGPGQPQQAWEHPRVISREVESSVGLSAHGYHFREDVLRALGNSVYEDTDELAFRDLLRKHGIKI